MSTCWTFVPQPSCGTVKFQPDGKVLIVGREGASPLHALGHIVLRGLPHGRKRQAMTESEWSSVSRTIESAMNIKSGCWSDAAEERFVACFEAVAQQKTGVDFPPRSPVGATVHVPRALRVVIQALITA